MGWLQVAHAVSVPPEGSLTQALRDVTELRHIASTLGILPERLDVSAGPLGRNATVPLKRAQRGRDLGHQS